MTAALNTPRRYYLLKRLWHACVLGDSATSGVWRSKQEGEPGTALAAGFPYLAELTAAGYTTQEDLDGADVAELVRYVKLTEDQAVTVLASA